MTEPIASRARRALRGRSPTLATPSAGRRLPSPAARRRGRSTRRSCCSRRTSCAPTRRAAALFTELRRVLGPGGRVVVAEHLRDAANFLAFGPGFLHFHSRAHAGRAASRGRRFDIHAEFPITPFVRVFVLRRLT